MPAIIRTLWGENGPRHRWQKVWRRDVKPRLRRPWTCDQHVYVYGKDNADRLSQYKIPRCKVVLIDNDPFPFGKDEWGGHYMHRPWLHKIELLRRAVEDHGEIIYCDWDIVCRVTDVPAAFGRLEGRPYNLTAFWYRRPREISRKTFRGRRISVSGNWIHCRGPEWLDRMLAIMRPDKEVWSWHDEFTMNHLIDQDHNGWPGEKLWLKKYESPIMCQLDCRSPWGVKKRKGDVTTRKTPVRFTWTRQFAYGKE